MLIYCYSFTLLTRPCRSDDRGHQPQRQDTAVHLLRAARLQGTQTVTLVYVIIRVYLHRVCIYLGQRGYEVHKL